MLFNIIHANYQCIYILIIKGIMRCMQKTELSRKIRLKISYVLFSKQRIMN